MDTTDLFERLALAFSIGLLFGIERGWQERDADEGGRTAGIRTFTLIGLLGGIWGAMTPALGAVPLSVAGLALGIAFTLFYWRESEARHEYSVTSVVAGLVAFSLGAFAVIGNMAAAGAAAVAAVGLLAARQSMHQFVKRVTWPELRSGVLLLAMTFVALPILPDRTVDPWGTINPHELWLMTVLIAAVSFLGYVGVRLIGARRGLVLASAAGSFISSTTVTLNNSRLAREDGGKGDGMLSVAVLVAWTISILRMTSIAVSVNPSILLPLWQPILAAAAIFVLAILYFLQSTRKNSSAQFPAFDNPLDLIFVLKFGALLSFVTVVANLVQGRFGEGGLLSVAGITGFLDVDPITLSASRAAHDSMMVREAADAILLAAAANLVTKMSFAVTVGGPRFGVKLVAVGVAAIAAAGATLFWTGV